MGRSLNPRIFKKQAKRAVQLLISHGRGEEYTSSDSECGGTILSELIGLEREQRMEKRSPARYDLWNRITGIPLHWYRSDYWEPEYNFNTPQQVWRDHLFYESGNFDEEMHDFKPRKLTYIERRMSTKAIAEGWKWRGNRAVKAAPIVKD